MGQTFEQYLRAKMSENGMFDDMIDKVMPLIMQDKCLDNMRGRWTECVEGYPQGMAASVFLLAKTVIADWLKVNAPMAWFRPVFAPDLPDSFDKMDSFIRDFWASQSVPTVSEKAQ